MMMRTFMLSVALVATAPVGYADPVIPKFVEETESSGLNSVYTGDWEYMVGGGVATFDCNGDGFPDILTTGGSSLAKFYVNTSKEGGTLTFNEQKSGLEIENVTGAYPLDVDSDGVMDVVLLRSGENIAMRGLGGCKFSRANEAWNFDGGNAWHSSFAATFEKNQTWPTIAIGTYIDLNKPDEPWGSCTENVLLRPEDQKFAAPHALTPSYCALSMLFTDWNKSGTPGLRVSNDREYYEGGQEQMWKIPTGAMPELYTEAEGWKRLRIWGMGMSSADINFDGYPDYFLTSMADSKLQTLADDKTKPIFKDIAFASGVTAHRPYEGTDLKPSTGWHSQFEDVNNDGLVDLFIAKGNVDHMPDFAQADPNNLLLQTDSGKFLESGDKAGVDSTRASRGAAVIDFNLDGELDLVVINRREKAQIWRNTNRAGHWIEVKLQQPNNNRDALGAILEVQQGGHILRREITVGGGLASGHLGWWHFGLGPETETKLRAIWPDGSNGAWQDVKANQFYVLDRGASKIAIWSPH
jgi:enediyne biosynthesis protein E4